MSKTRTNRVYILSIAMKYRYVNTTWIENEYFLQPYIPNVIINVIIILMNYEYFVSIIKILYAYWQ